MTALVSLVVEVPDSIVTTMNDRLNRKYEAARQIKALRFAGCQAARGLTLTGRQHATITYRWHNGRGPTDPLNLAPTAKALIDGIVGDAGALPNDSDRWLVGPDLRRGPRWDNMRRFVRFTIDFQKVA